MALHRLPNELIADILATSDSNAAHVAAASGLVHAAREYPGVTLAWAHHIIAASDASIMDEAVADHWTTPASLDKYRFPSTRGLPTPATWLMKRLLRGLANREYISHNWRFVNRVPVPDLVLDPSPFSVPAVVSYMLRAHRFPTVALVPLDEALRAWDVPPVLDERTYSWTMDVPEQLATQLAAPCLRPIPEALQLPGLYLYTRGFDLFKSTVRQLADLLPTLRTAKAPLQLWTRLGLDDRFTTRRDLAQLRIDDDQYMELVLEDITLPTYWAMIAAAEGHRAVLEYLVDELDLEARAFARFLSQQGPTTFVLQSLIQFAAADRVLPTWHWLVEHGYEYPAAECGPITKFVNRAVDYLTVRTLFLECDKPRILATTDLAERLEENQHIPSYIWPWAIEGNVDLITQFAELRILEPSSICGLLHWTLPSSTYLSLLAVIEPLLPLIVGGVEAIIAYCLRESSWDYGSSIRLIYHVQPDQFADMVAQNYQQKGFVNALMSINDVQDRIDLAALFTTVVEFLSTVEPVNSAGMGYPTIYGAGMLVMHALCDIGDLGRSAGAAIDALGGAKRVLLFVSLLQELPKLTYGTGPNEMPAPTLPAGAAPDGWPTWQCVLERVVPDLLESPADLTENAEAMSLLSRGSRVWQVARPATGQLDVDRDTAGYAARWADPPTAEVVASLPVDTDRPDYLHELWAAARLAILAPDVALAQAVFSGQTPAWVWRLRLDTLQQGGNEPTARRLSNWPALVARVLACGGKHASALHIMQIAYEEQRIHGSPSVNYAGALHGMAKKWPKVLELAHEAGFEDV
ncbi:hypothetical protein BC828DRAFT_279694 [Blastocladiella britannica]|nr:hypothetical protein BC828DRAFT_279694 [Blastocladiella britannica]